MEVRLKRLNQRNDTNDGKDDGNNDTTALAAGSKAATAEWCEKVKYKVLLFQMIIYKHTVFKLMIHMVQIVMIYYIKI